MASDSSHRPGTQNHEVNTYIPSFISKKPFYVPDDASTADYLDHQRLQKATPDQSIWYDRGKRLGPAATKFRKGACENCGAMTHKTKDCLSRPRAKGARWTGKDIQADEVVQDVELGWDAKRDRWNGYDASEYRAVIDEYEELEKLKRRAKAPISESMDPSNELEEVSKADEEEAKYAEESDMGRQQSTSTRNLRLREDTAKYLLNLDLDSAKYDPKTRSMVDMGAQTDLAAALVAEDNFMRASGDAEAFEKAQKYAWESQERGDKNKTHVQANPTSGEYFMKKQKEEAEAKREAHRKLLIEKYGADQSLQRLALENVAVTENERYVEYDDAGEIKGAPQAALKSKYPEDILINNHTSVWGSWWRDFEWGFACCNSTIKNSYCTGEEGKRAFEDAHNRNTGGELISMSVAAATGAVGGALEEQEGGANDEQRMLSTGLPAIIPDHEKAPNRKRTMAEMQAGVSEEELEAYKRSRAVADDPMARFLGKDELVQ